MALTLCPVLLLRPLGSYAPRAALRRTEPHSRARRCRRIGGEQPQGFGKHINEQRRRTLAFVSWTWSIHRWRSTETIRTRRLSAFEIADCLGPRRLVARSRHPTHT